MREVSKSEFKRIYFQLGKSRGGWDRAYWERSFEDDPRPSMKFLVEDPATARETEMWIVIDYDANEYRLFFRTAEDSDDILVFPSTDD